MKCGEGVVLAGVQRRGLANREMMPKKSTGGWRPWYLAHLKYLHSVVVVVRDVHLSRRVDRDAVGAVELAVAETA